MKVLPIIFKTKQTITLSHTPLIDYEMKDHWHSRQNLMHSPKIICLCLFFQPMSYESKLLNLNMISPNLNVQFKNCPFTMSGFLALCISDELPKGPDDSDSRQYTLHRNPKQHNKLTEANGGRSSHKELNVRKHSGLQTSLNSDSNVSRALNLTCKMVIC